VHAYPGTSPLIAFGAVAAAEYSPVFSLKFLIVNSINYWIEAAVAHGQPMCAEEYDVYVSIFIDIRSHFIEHQICLVWQPTKREHSNDH